MSIEDSIAIVRCDAGEFTSFIPSSRFDCSRRLRVDFQATSVGGSGQNSLEQGVFVRLTLF